MFQSADRSPLFSPFELKSLQLKNRIVMAPMTRSSSPDGVPTKEVAAYYGRRAAGDVGLILTESTSIDRPSAGNEPNMPKFWGGAALAGWTQVRTAVHEAGGRIGPQLQHVGGCPNPFMEWRPAAEFETPSGDIVYGGTAHTLSLAEIDDVIDAFANAARNARDIGFDLVELHGAHGFLIDQFFQPQFNRRDDRFGGTSLASRAALAVETIRAVRAAVGADFPIVMRISQWKAQDYSYRLANSPRELEAWLLPLVDAGLDMFDCSQRRFWEPEFAGSELNLAGWVKKVTGLPTITCGSVGLSVDFVTTVWHGAGSAPARLDALLERISRDEFDLVSVGRALLNDPLWARKVRLGFDEEILPLDPENLNRLT